MRKITRHLFLVLLASLMSFSFINCSGGFEDTISVKYPDNSPLNGDDPVPSPQQPIEKMCSVAPVTIQHSPNFMPATAVKVYLDLVKYPNAKCNDGTPATYVFRPGFGVAKNRWLIYLQGGGHCATEESCRRRTQMGRDLLTSNPSVVGNFYQDVGIMSSSPSVNPDFYDASMVKVHYCSSDGWSGNFSPNEANINNIPTGWHFQGKAILEAVIDDLKTKYGLNFADEVILSGGSAGGVGTFSNASKIKSLLLPNVRYVSIPDASYRLATAGFDPTQSNGISTAPGTPYDDQDQAALSLWHPIGDLECEKTMTDQSLRVKCANPPFIATSVPSFEVPTLIVNSLKDQNLLSNEGLNLTSFVSLNSIQSSYINFFADSMRISLAKTTPYVSVFAVDSFEHTTIESVLFSTQSYTFITASGSETLNYQQAISRWYKNPCEQIRWIQ